MTATRRPDRPTPEERLTALHEKLVTAVEQLARSDAWATMLAVAARFPTYSPSNVLLIAAQRPDATRVAGIRTWNALGRRVTKGEHGIAILAPCLYTRRDEPTGGAADTAPSSGARDQTAQAEPDAGPISRRELRGFTVVHVFDVTQTQGQPLPDVAPELLTGPAPEDLWGHLCRQLDAAEYVLERGDCGPANGWTDPETRTVRIRDNVDPAQALKTLAHELGHIRADHPRRFPDYAIDHTCRGQAEIEAESIAHLVLAAAGVDTTGYSVPYLAGWSYGDPTQLRDAATVVITTARRLVPTPVMTGASPARVDPSPVPEHPSAAARYPSS